jgi:hypothetical protein
MPTNFHSLPPALDARFGASDTMDKPIGSWREPDGTGGEAEGVSRDLAVTDGGPAGTSGWSPQRILVAGMGVWFALLAIQISVNSMSHASEHSDMPAWHSWCLEMTSAFGWLCVTPLLWRLVRELTVRARRPLMFLAMAVAGSVALSLIHVGVMMTLRVAIFSATGGHYNPTDPWAGIFLYEYRKDASSLLQIGLGFYAIQWLMRRAAFQNQPSYGQAPEPRSEVVVEVQDGPSTHFVPLGEIDQVAAAGNYVEIAWRGRTLLHRTTLAALEQAWAPHGFARIHRATLVRAAAVVRIETLKSGDFTAELAGGALVRGSRRYRAALDGALQAP